MDPLLLRIANGLKVVAMFLALYVYAPFWLTPQRPGDDAFDRLFAAFVRMATTVILLVHTLALVKLYDLFSAFGGLVLVCLFMLWRRGAALASMATSTGHNAMAGLLDTVEVGGTFTSGVRRFITSRVEGVKDLTRHTVHSVLSPFSGLPTLISLGLAAYMRFYYPMLHSAPGASDTYVHLVWIKYLDAGNLFRDGIYPRGYHALISFMGRITFLDPHEIMRFIGPLGGWLLCVSIYYVALRLTKNPGAAALATGLYAIGRGFPNDIWRQMNALPQEFSAIFMMPGVLYISRYLETGDNYYLYLFGQCLFVTLTVHPYVSVYLVLATALAGFASLLRRRLTVRKILMVGVAGVVSAAASLVWLGAGLVLGYKFHGSLVYMEQSYKAGTLSVSQFFSFRDFFSGPVELKVSLAIAAAMVLLVIAMARGKRHRDWEGTLVGTTGLLALALLLLARARFLGLPEPMDISRTTMFFGVSLAVIFGFPLSEPETFPAGIMHRLLPEKVLSRWGSIVRYIPPLLLLVMIVTSPIKPPRGDTSEYDQAVDNYYTIRNSYPPFDWTIVSPTEQYSAALGRGWHYDMVEFLTKYPPEKASDPAFDPAVPTTYIFIYVERVVFKLDQPPGADDASKPIPQEGGWASYYRNPGNRAIIEAKAQLWCDEYGRTHTNMAIQYEDPVFRVYKITHVPKYER